ncbi:MAG: hypothetical protein ABSA47_10220 [Verrucomicrobiota bacterium]|jgi:site-specific DNA-cytosine methylase
MSNVREKNFAEFFAGIGLMRIGLERAGEGGESDEFVSRESQKFSGFEIHAHKICAESS